MNASLGKKTPCALLFALTGLTLWFGCKKDDDPVCGISGLSYTANIKGIIDRRCISCHAAGSGVAGADIFDFRTYEGMKTHLDEGHVLERVVVKKDMPQAGSVEAMKMTQAERDSINCWILSGYPKN